MSRIVNLSIWLFIGLILVFLASNFSIGSREHWDEQINNHFVELITVRSLGATIVGMIWTIVAYFLYKAFADGADKKLKFGKYFLLATLGYFVVAIISTLIFIYNR